MTSQNMEQKLQHLFDGTSLNVYDSNVLNLGVGAPGADLLENCCGIFEQATQHRLKFEREHNSSNLFQYGPKTGIYEARDEIAKYLSQEYKDVVKSEDLFITAGASQGLHFVLSSVLDLNGFVFVDEVTYMIALDVIRQYPSVTIVPLKLKSEGVDVQQFEELLKTHQFKSSSKEFWGLYYTIPTYHNPTGILFSEDVCKSLICLARQYDVLITCDDVYNILHYTDTPPPKRLFAYDERTEEGFCGNVISNGSFSKIIGPGIRLGWLEVPARIKRILENAGVCKSGGCFNNYTSGILASLFQLGLAQAHVRKLYDAYKERMLSTLEVLQKELPSYCTMTAPCGGYFIWITLPEGVEAAKFLKFCLKEEKIWFLAGRIFAAEDAAKNCFRISIAFHSKEKLVDGARRLCSAIRKCLDNK